MAKPSYKQKKHWLYYTLKILEIIKLYLNNSKKFSEKNFRDTEIYGSHEPECKTGWERQSQTRMQNMWWYCKAQNTGRVG